MPRWPARQPLTDEQSRKAASCYRLALKLARYYSSRGEYTYDECLDAATDGLVNAAVCHEEGKGALMTSFTGISVRFAMSKLRRNKRRAKRAVPGGHEFRIYNEDGDEDHPAEDGRFPDDSPDFDGLVSCLEGLERGVIELRYRGDLTYREIGERLGISHEMARKVELRALARLRGMGDGQ